jgi:hypothetical protein
MNNAWENHNSKKEFKMQCLEARKWTQPTFVHLIILSLCPLISTPLSFDHVSPCYTLVLLSALLALGLSPSPRLLLPTSLAFHRCSCISLLVLSCFLLHNDNDNRASFINQQLWQPQLWANKRLLSYPLSLPWPFNTKKSLQHCLGNLWSIILSQGHGLELNLLVITPSFRFSRAHALIVQRSRQLWELAPAFNSCVASFSWPGKKKGDGMHASGTDRHACMQQLMRDQYKQFTGAPRGRTANSPMNAHYQIWKSWFWSSALENRKEGVCVKGKWHLICFASWCLVYLKSDILSFLSLWRSTGCPFENNPQKIPLGKKLLTCTVSLMTFLLMLRWVDCLYDHICNKKYRVSGLDYLTPKTKQLCGCYITKINCHAADH